ncbi:MAG: hypothetical protein QW350_01525 [Candidatus Aenigmatarchaeota archaeon]
MIKFLGGAKKQPEKPPLIGKGFIPTDKVKDLSNKGFSEPEIIDILRKDGFSSEEIDRALTQTLKIGVTGEENSMPTLNTLNQQQEDSYYQSGDLQPFFQSFQQNPSQPIQPAQSFQSQQPIQQQEYYQPQEYISEEVIESIVHEKMSDLDERLVEFRNKYNELERKILDLHNQLSIFAKGGKERESETISKIDSLRDSVDELNAKMSSLEKTFKEVLPSLIESVRALTDLVHEMKRKN